MSRTAWTYAAADSLAATPAASAIPAAPITAAPAPAAPTAAPAPATAPLTAAPTAATHPAAAAASPAAALSARPHPAAPAAADTLAAADSLPGAAPPDSLASLFAAGRTPDGILFLPDAEQLGAGLWRDTTARAVFGAESVAVPAGKLQLPDTDSLTENGVFQSFVLLLAAMYAMLLYRNIGDIRTLFGNLSREASSRERLTEDPGSSGFSRFLHIVTAIGMLFLGVMAVKYGDTLLPHFLTGTLPRGAVLALSLLATLACTLIVLLQGLLLRAVGALTVSQDFIARLLLLRRCCFALTVLLTSPALLLFALCPRNTGDVWFLIITIELAVAAILYLRESLRLFISKKISILNWILYLCSVEIFPASLVWLLLAR